MRFVIVTDLAEADILAANGLLWYRWENSPTDRYGSTWLQRQLKPSDYNKVRLDEALDRFQVLLED